MNARGKSSESPPQRRVDGQPGGTANGGGAGARTRWAREGDGAVLTARVLVVDDDDDFREIVVEILARAGWQPLQATSGQEALDLVRREQPNVVMLDQRMPGLCGADVILRLRELDYPGSIVLVTAASDVAEIARSLDVQFYLQKPVGLGQLKTIIRQAMTRGAAIE